MLNVLYYIIAALAVLGLSFTSIYFKVKDKLKSTAIEAETEVDDLDLTGKEKMEIVVNCLLDYLPVFAKFMFKKQSIEDLAQITYDELKKFWQQRDTKNSVKVTLSDIKQENESILNELNEIVATMQDAIDEEQIVPLKGGDETNDD